MSLDALEAARAPVFTGLVTTVGVQYVVANSPHVGALDLPAGLPVARLEYSDDGQYRVYIDGHEPVTASWGVLDYRQYGHIVLWAGPDGDSYPVIEIRPLAVSDAFAASVGMAHHRLGEIETQFRRQEYDAHVDAWCRAQAVRYAGKRLHPERPFSVDGHGGFVIIFDDNSQLPVTLDAGFGVDADTYDDPSYHIVLDGHEVP